MTKLSREAILAIQDLESEEVSVPEWDTAITVRGLTAAERDDFEAWCIKGKGKNTELNLRNLRAKLVARSCMNGDGQRLFTDQDVEALGGKSAAAVQRLFAAAQRLSGFSAEDVEELVGNSGSALPDDSPSV